MSVTEDSHPSLAPNTPRQLRAGESESEMGVPTVTLHNGYEMPALGVSTWRNFAYLIHHGWREKVDDYVHRALTLGFNHLDCGMITMNLNKIKAAIGRWNGNRENLFITAKVWNTHHSKKRCHEAVNKMLDELECSGYFDLAMIEWPRGFAEDHEAVITSLNDRYYIRLCELYPNDGEKFIYSDVDFMETWKALEECVLQGKARSIGIANFSLEQVQRVWKESNIKPAVLQIEVTPYLPQNELREFCKQKSIIVSTLPPIHDSELLKDPIISRISDEIDQSPSQVLLRWLLQSNVAVLPKAMDERRSSLEVFSFALSPEHMEQIDNMEQKETARPRDQPEWPFYHKVIPTRPLSIPRKGRMSMIGISWDKRGGKLKFGDLEKLFLTGIRTIDYVPGAGNHELKKLSTEARDGKTHHLFVSTRISPFQNSFESCKLELYKLKALKSHTRPRLELDLLLMHCPRHHEMSQKQTESMENYIGYLKTWEFLQCAASEHFKKYSFGLSDFNVQQIESIWNLPNFLKPAVVYVEMSPYIAQTEVREYCGKKGIAVVANKIFGGDVLIDPVITEIAETIQKSPREVVLRWFIQNDVVALIPSTDPSILEPLDIACFSLSPNQMNSINSLDKGQSCWKSPIVEMRP